MNENTISGDLIGVALRQLGATSIKEVHSMMHIANFDLGGGVEVSYVFNITKDSRYFLQRMRPYPLPQGKFSDAQEIIDFITVDIAAFRNAHNSKNFPRFVQVNDRMGQLVGQLEDLFLHYNVDGDALAAFHNELEKLVGAAETLRGQAKPL
ncbi:hypothetical protein LI291_06995 [Intestinibacillus massiliensis]|uniref:hypothetical protein n=1 Tax=Intestinibacillus massiliensis TaxID=1871029 RepID=UPI000B35A50F|nr:hypothetical protein [Intestinibacillus massiliensis]MCB6365918.1 hypothetical protein [Intestinibacillus massiliensis]